jgi:macrolide transport system ATP-binding/permease protein
VNGLQVLAILKRLHREGHTIVMVTHDQAVAEHADRILVVRDGRIAEDRRVEKPRDAEKELEELNNEPAPMEMAQAAR